MGGEEFKCSHEGRKKEHIGETTPPTDHHTNEQISKRFLCRLGEWKKRRQKSRKDKTHIPKETTQPKEKGKGTRSKRGQKSPS